MNQDLREPSENFPLIFICRSGKINLVPRKSTELIPYSARVYTELRASLEAIFSAGKKQIDAIKIQVYWESGQVLQDFLHKHSKQTPGDEIRFGLIERLSKDLQIERGLFYRMLRFVEAFPKLPEKTNLTWTHYRELIAIKNESQRKELLNATEKNEWSSRRLALEIQKISAGKKPLKAKPKTAETLIEPKRARTRVYQIGWLTSLGGKKQKVVDFGFHFYKPLAEKESKKLEVGSTVVWSDANDAWLPAGAKEDLYHYQAQIERVVDGDTLLVHVQFAQGNVSRQYLRLRAVDAADLKESQGKKAFQFVSKFAKENPTILFKSRSRDKFDRYISDVWMGDLYLNQALLDKGLAGKA